MEAMMKLTKRELIGIYYEICPKNPKNKTNCDALRTKKEWVELIQTSTYIHRTESDDLEKYKTRVWELLERIAELKQREEQFLAFDRAVLERSKKLEKENEELKEQIKKEREIFAKLTNAHIEEIKRKEDFIVESLNSIKN